MDALQRRLAENLEDPIRAHLKNVYLTFTLAILVAAVGGYTHMFTLGIGGRLTINLVATSCFFCLMLTPYNGENQLERLSFLCCFSFLTGSGLSPLLPTLMLQTLLETSIVFISFSIVATFYAPTGHYLYIGGTLLSTLFFISFCCSRLNFIIMCVFIVFDTQNIITRARGGDKDYVMHSLLLFLDFVIIFKRLLKIKNIKK